MAELVGNGELSLPDGRLWGLVRYRIGVTSPTTQSLGMIGGTLVALDPKIANGPFPFWDLTQGDLNEMYGALRLDDGRWWICNVQPDGAASNRAGGIRSTGPQPKP
jgi:hypothetical protein